MNKNLMESGLSKLLVQVLSAKLTELLFILDEQLNILFINDSAKKLFHCPNKEIYGVSFSTFCSQKKIDSNLFTFVSHSVKEIKQPAQALLYKNSELTWSIESIDHRDTKVYIVQTTNFIQNKDKETIHNLVSLIENMPCNVYWMNKECLMVGCNQNVLNMLKMNKEEFIGKSYEELSQLSNWPEGLAAKLKNDDLTVINTGNPILNVEDPPIPNQDDSTGSVAKISVVRIPTKVNTHSGRSYAANPVNCSNIV